MPREVLARRAVRRTDAFMFSDLVLSLACLRLACGDSDQFGIGHVSHNGIALALIGERIAERVRAGLKRAKDEGKTLGRPKKLVSYVPERICATLGETSPQ
jgi:hypothetical protein